MLQNFLHSCKIWRCPQFWFLVPLFHALCFFLPEPFPYDLTFFNQISGKKKMRCSSSASKREPATHFDHIHYVRYVALEERTMQLPPKDLGSQAYHWNDKSGSQFCFHSKIDLIKRKRWPWQKYTKNSEVTLNGAPWLPNMQFLFVCHLMCIFLQKLHLWTWKSIHLPCYFCDILTFSVFQSNHCPNIFKVITSSKRMVTSTLMVHHYLAVIPTADYWDV